MYANQIKELVWRSALRQDPQPGTFQPRTASSGGPGSYDSFGSYPLQRVTYRPPTLQEIGIREGSVEDRTAVFTVYQKDLEISQAPRPPQMTDMLSFNVGLWAFDGSWIIERTSSDNLHSFYTCFCRIAH